MKSLLTILAAVLLCGCRQQPDPLLSARVAALEIQQSMMRSNLMDLSGSVRTQAEASIQIVHEIKDLKSRGQ